MCLIAWMIGRRIGRSPINCALRSSAENCSRVTSCRPRPVRVELHQCAAAGLVATSRAGLTCGSTVPASLRLSGPLTPTKPATTTVISRRWMRQPRASSLPHPPGAFSDHHFPTRRRTASGLTSKGGHYGVLRQTAAVAQAAAPAACAAVRVGLGNTPGPAAVLLMTEVVYRVRVRSCCRAHPDERHLG